MDNLNKEIYKLINMLTEADIPFDFYERDMGDQYQIFQILYPSVDIRVCSVIQGDYTYGGKYDLLEIRGLLTRRERKHDLVAGFLTSVEVFKRIERHYKKLSKKLNKN